MKELNYINSLNYDKDRFIFGKDIQTDYGVLRFLTYEEYLFYSNEVSLIGQNVLHIYYHFLDEMKKAKASKDELDALKEIKGANLLEVVLSTSVLLNAYLKIFNLVFDKNSDEEVDFQAIFSDLELFMFIRQIVMDMNVIVEERVSSNEVIQQAFERSKRVKSRDTQKQTSGDIISSIVAGTSHKYEEIADMTIFQVYLLYARLGAIYNHKATTLFATVAEKIEIESWNKHINLFEVEQDTMTRDQFTKKFGDMLNG